MDHWWTIGGTLVDQWFGSFMLNQSIVCNAHLQSTYHPMIVIIVSSLALALGVSFIGLPFIIHLTNPVSAVSFSVFKSIIQFQFQYVESRMNSKSSNKRTSRKSSRNIQTRAATLSNSKNLAPHFKSFGNCFKRARWQLRSESI